MALRKRHGIPTDPIDLDLTLKIKDFGPINNANITLKPLTVFIGPNNSGKSYAALLVHSIINIESEFMNHLSPFYYPHFRLENNELNNSIKKHLKSKKSFTLSSKFILNFMKNSLEKIIKEKLPSEINKNFSSEFNQLIRIGSNAFSLQISSNIFSATINHRNGKSQITNIVYPKFKIKINLNSSDHGKELYNYDIQSTSITINVAKLPEKILFEQVHEAIFFAMFEYLQQKIPRDSFYFPAARSGILQGHKAISASIIQNAPYVGLKNLEIPKLSGVVSDFISNILVLPGHAGPFLKYADNLEKEILHGKIKVDHMTSGTEINYHYKNQDIPLHRTSSTVSELAPFTLYLRFIINLGSVLIIEEPEAHLHPHNQCLFAKHLVRLIRCGLNIIITTHSPFILEQLSNFIQTDKVSAKSKKNKSNFGENDYLKIEEIAAYYFQQRSDTNNVVKPLEISKKDGISQEEFIKVSERLYDEYLEKSKNM